MMVIGRTIKLMDMDSTHILMEHNMKATGLMINNMDKVKNTGQMVLNMKEHINMVKKMDTVNSFGLINHLIVVLLSIITSMVMENIDGLIIENTLETGLTIKCMVQVSLLGPMEESMRANILMTRNKVMVFSHGQMVDSMMVSG